MIALVDNGLPRDEAHEVLRTASMNAINSGDELEDICAMSDSISKIFTRQELSDLFKPESHLGFSGEIVDMAVEMARNRI